MPLNDIVLNFYLKQVMSYLHGLQPKKFPHFVEYSHLTGSHPQRVQT